MTKKILFYCTVMLFQLNAMAQPAASNNLHSVIPPSPDAASLGKFGDIPVNYASGVPEISIPVYTINQSGLEIPVSLSYHAGGIKVEERASWVGLGWVLNAGGAVTRAVAGLPDESQLGYLEQTYNIDDIPGMDENAKADIADQVRNATLDLEPDVFYFNFMGKSGKFFIDKATLKPIIIPQNANLSISFTMANHIISAWDITDERGYVYHFQTSEMTWITHGGRTKQSFPMLQQFRSTWYLNSITTPFNSTISFTYQDYECEYYTRQTATKYYFLGSSGTSMCSSPTTENHNYDKTKIFGKRISAIEFDNGRVVFTGTAADREDITGDYSLDRIRVYDKNNILIRDFNLLHSYFQSNVFEPPLAFPHTGKRLRLDGIEMGPVSPAQVHSFEYNSGFLPSVFAFAQDHWGYYNGESNQFLIPLAANQSTGSRRHVSENHAKYGTLKKVTYPTGGSTEIYYESNEAVISEQEYYDFFHRYGGSSTEYQQPYWVGLNVGQPENTVNLTVDPATIPIDASGNNFTYNIYLNNFNTCPGNEKPCIGSLRITLTCVDCDPPNQLVYDLSTMNDYVNGVSQGKVKLLPNKTYLLRRFGQGSSEIAVNITGIKEVPPANPEGDVSIKVGGLRVSKMVDIPVAGLPVTTEFYYTNDINYTGTGSPTYTSSGQINGFPIYDYIHEFTVVEQGINGEFIGYCYYRVMSGSSLAPLAVSGSSVTYATVQKAMIGANEIHKSVYKFTTSEQHPDHVSYAYPYTLIRSNDYRRGLLIEEQNYLVNGAQFTPLTKREYQYQFSDFKRIPGMKVACAGSVQDHTGSGLAGCTVTMMPLYGLTTEWVTKVTEIATDFSGGGSPLVVQTDYHYENAQHRLPTRIVTKNSRGEINTRKVKYPLDFPDITATDAVSAGIKNLIDKHVITPEIEISGFRSNADGSNQRLISSVFKTYKTSQPLPDGLFAIESVQPLTDFVSSGVQTGSVTKDSRYQPKLSFDLYDNNGNVLQQKKANDINQSYIWDYVAAFPIAQIINADQSSTAYTSFEADGSGSWAITSGTRISDGITGNKCYEVSDGDITRNNLSASAAYVVSYWTKNQVAFNINGTQGNAVEGRAVDGWRCFMHLVTGVTEVRFSGSGLIDELRLYPKGAQMTTYTYHPLVGMTSQCDISNKIMYYEYDEIGRLKIIRDLDKNILKTFDYQLQAFAHNNPVWTSTLNSRCKPCAANNAYPTDVVQSEEKDINPNSATYNQTRWIDIGSGGACVISPDWQFTATAIRCKQVSGQNNGEQEREQRDMNPCSSTFNQLRWIVTGTDPDACPVPYVCDYNNCTVNGPDWSCINNNCEQGIKVYHSSIQVAGGLWWCYYHYEFSDGSWSTEYEEESPVNCMQ